MIELKVVIEHTAKELEVQVNVSGGGTPGERAHAEIYLCGMKAINELIRMRPAKQTPETVVRAIVERLVNEAQELRAASEKRGTVLRDLGLSDQNDMTPGEEN